MELMILGSSFLWLNTPPKRENHKDLKFLTIAACTVKVTKPRISNSHIWQSTFKNIYQACASSVLKRRDPINWDVWYL